MQVPEPELQDRPRGGPRHDDHHHGQVEGAGVGRRSRMYTAAQQREVREQKIQALIKLREAENLALMDELDLNF